MTKDQAVTELLRNWASCSDAFGLLTALELIGVVKFDEPDPSDLVVESKRWNRPGGILPITDDTVSAASNLIGRLGIALEKALTVKPEAPQIRQVPK